MRIVADSQITLLEPTFSAFGEIKAVSGRAIGAGTLAAADALLVRSVTRVDADLLSKSHVHFVGSATSGIDHIDQAYLARHNIDFVHAPGHNARSVAEYVLSCLYALKQAADQCDGHTKPLTELLVGIIGCGHVGSALRDLLEVLGIACLCYDPPLKEKTGDPRYCELTDIIQADVISLHVPFTQTGPYLTQQMINADFLQACRSDAVLINTARGEVVDEQALLAHLQKYPAFTLIADVWQREPSINSSLLSRVRFATPHIAGYSLDAKLAASGSLYQALARVNGDPVPEWSPSPMLSGGSEGPIVIGRDGDPIAQAILGAYDVRKDNAALKAVLQLEPVHRGGHFDTLRKHYPVRREFSARTVILNRAHGHRQGQLLKRLGFKVAVS